MKSKTYGAMIVANKEIYLEEIWKDIDKRLAGTSDRVIFFCGKPLHSAYLEEKFENTVFRLMELVHLDGLIALSGSLAQFSQKEELSQYLERFDQIPIVSISMDLDGCHNVLVSNYESSKQLAEHAISVHGYKRFAYIAGPVDNDEANDRLQAVTDVLAMYDMSIPPCRFYQGDFQTIEGYHGAKAIISEARELPEVIICANDEMAIGAMNYILKAGFKIPEDIAIMGFDDIGGAKLAKVPLTTVKQSFAQKMSIAYDLINIYDKPVTTKVKGDLVARTSCGCMKQLLTANEENQLRREYMNRYQESLEGFSLTMQMSSFFASIIDKEDLKQRLTTFFLEHEMTELYLCLFNDEKRSIGKPEEFVYPEKMNCFFGYNRGKVYDSEIFEVKDLLPNVVLQGSQSNTYLVYSLVFKDLNYGYLVCDNITANSMAFVALKDMLTNTLHRIDMYQQVEQYSKKMEAQSLKDPLTNLFNRRGFNQLTESVFSHLTETGKRPVVIYCDLIGLKLINDRFGHESGDFAIVEAARILSEFFSFNEIIGRVGGDEYLVFLNDMEEEAYQSLQTRFAVHVHEWNSKLDLPYNIGISIGVCRYHHDEPMSLVEMIRAADNELYDGRKVLRQH